MGAEFRCMTLELEMKMPDGVLYQFERNQHGVYILSVIYPKTGGFIVQVFPGERPTDERIRSIVSDHYKRRCTDGTQRV